MAPEERRGLLWLGAEGGDCLGLGAMPVVPWLAAWRVRHFGLSVPGASSFRDGVIGLAAYLALVAIFIYASVHLSASTYNPFIYFRF